MNQAIHQVDLLRWFVGPVARVVRNVATGRARTAIESEDMRHAPCCGMPTAPRGVIQASRRSGPAIRSASNCTAPSGTAIVTGDRLTTWDVQDDHGEAAARFPTQVASGASDPMAISLEPFERQFLDFGRRGPHAGAGPS